MESGGSNYIPAKPGIFFQENPLVHEHRHSPRKFEKKNHWYTVSQISPVSMVFFKIISKTKIFNYTELHSTEYRRHPVCQMDTFPRE